MNETTLGGKTVYDPPANSDIVATNFFQCFTGAARFGFGKFLLLRADFDALIASSSDGSAVLRMMSPDNGTSGPPGLTLTVVIAGAKPVAVGTDNSQMVEVVVHDRRCRMQEPKRKAFNVQKSGFPMAGAALAAGDCYSSTLLSGALYTWAQVASALEIAGSPTIPNPAPAFGPRNLIFDNVPHARMIEDVMARLFVVVGYLHQANQFTLNAPGVVSAANTSMLTAAANYLIAGKEGIRSAKRIPGEIDVTFMSHQEDPAADPFTNRVYQKACTNPTGQANVKESLHVGEYIAVYRDGSAVNSTELDTCAADVAARYATFAGQQPGEQQFAGIWPFVPDGKIRGIRWISGPSDGPEAWRGATTTILYNNDRDFFPMEDMQRYVDTRSNQSLIGLGGAVVALGTGGTRMVHPDTTQKVRYGKLTADKKAETYLVLTPCNAAGTVASPTPPTVNVMVHADQSGGVGPWGSGFVFPYLSLPEPITVYNLAHTATAACDGVLVGATTFSVAGLIHCLLDKDGGSDGTKTTTPSYTYTATIYNTANYITPGTGLTPLDGRVNGSFNDAVNGLGYYDAAGVFQLLYAFETPNTNACT